MRPSLLGLALLVAACSPPPAAPMAAPAPIPMPPQPTESLEARGAALARSLLVVDGHVDLPHRLRKGLKDGAPTEDPSKKTTGGDFDYPRAKAGGLDAPFMSIYVPASFQKEGSAKAVADELIDLVEGMVASSPDKFALAPSADSLADSFSRGLIALPMGIENGAALEGELANVAHFHGRGVRYITLTHSEDNDICDSSYSEAHTHGGLSDFGREVVKEMNRVGVMVDVSHISDDAFADVMETTDVPVIASHSSCRHFTPGFERNLADSMIEQVAAEDGVVMINFGSTFLTAAARGWSDEYHAAREAFMDVHQVDRDHPDAQAFSEGYMKDHPLPRASVADVADHILHVIEIAGVDHVGFGSDFDGVGDSLPKGLRDPSELPHLFTELLERGVSEADLAKIASGNLLRVWRAVEAAAKG